MNYRARARLWLPGAAAFLAGCDTALSTLAPAGPVAGQIAWLWWAMLGGAVLITLLVAVLIVLGFGRPRDVPERRWTHGLGLWFSLAVLGALLAGALVVGERILPRDDGAVTVHAHAHQWGWRFAHPGPDGERIETEGVLHIPAGRPVDVIVTTEDVIHAFWVPRLAGKVDAVPGRENRVRLFADTAGNFGGLCAEFCGVGHAMMRFEVIAHPAEDWPVAVAHPDGGPE